jgi:hypothetical protein
MSRMVPSANNDKWSILVLAVSGLKRESGFRLIGRGLFSYRVNTAIDLARASVSENSAERYRRGELYNGQQRDTLTHCVLIQSLVHNTHTALNKSSEDHRALRLETTAARAARLVERGNASNKTAHERK